MPEWENLVTIDAAPAEELAARQIRAVLQEELDQLKRDGLDVEKLRGLKAIEDAVMLNGFGAGNFPDSMHLQQMSSDFKTAAPEFFRFFKQMNTNEKQVFGRAIQALLRYKNIFNDTISVERKPKAGASHWERVLPGFDHNPNPDVKDLGYLRDISLRQLMDVPGYTETVGKIFLTFRFH